MKQSGMNSNLVDKIIQRVHKEISHIMKNPASGDDLSRAINDLRDQICGQSKKLLAALRKAQTGEILVYCFGGIALIVVDISISASGVMSAIGVGASAAIGGSLFKDAVKEFVHYVTFS